MLQIRGRRNPFTGRKRISSVSMSGDSRRRKHFVEINLLFVVRRDELLKYTTDLTNQYMLVCRTVPIIKYILSE